MTNCELYREKEGEQPPVKQNLAIIKRFRKLFQNSLKRLGLIDNITNQDVDSKSWEQNGCGLAADRKFGPVRYPAYFIMIRYGPVYGMFYQKIEIWSSPAAGLLF